MEYHSWYRILILKHCIINIDFDSWFWKGPVLSINQQGIAQYTPMHTYILLILILNLDFDWLSSQESWYWYWIMAIFQEFFSWFWCWLCHRIFKNFDFDIEFSNTFSIKLILVLNFLYKFQKSWYWYWLCGWHFKNFDIDIEFF